MNSIEKQQFLELISKHNLDLLDIHKVQIKALELGFYSLVVYIRDNTTEYISIVKTLKNKSN